MKITRFDELYGETIGTGVTLGSVDVAGLGGIPADLSGTTDGYVITYVAADGELELKPIPTSAVSDSFDVTPALSNAMAAWVKPTGSGVITPDPQGRLTILNDTTYKAFVGMTFLEGTLHLVYRSGAGHDSSDGKVQYQTSKDLGRTWSAAVTIATPSGSHDFRDPSIVALSTGRLVVGYDDNVDGTAAHIVVYSMYSDNRGQSWSSPVLVPCTFSGEKAATSQMVELPSGTLLMPVFGDNGGNTFAALMKSTDHGATFPTQVTIATSGSRTYQEPQIRLLSSGNLVCLMRSDTNAHTWRTVSIDQGATWSTPADVLTASGRPDFAEFYPGALIIFVRTDNTNFYARWAVSWDEGATWTSLQTTDSSTDVLEYSAPVVLAPGYTAVAYSLQNSSTDADLYLRYYYDGYGNDPLGNVRALIGGTLVSTTAPTAGQVLTASSSTVSAWATPAASGSSSTDHEHIDNVTFSGDGSTAAFELPAAPFDAYSVAAYVAGARVGQSLSGTMLTTLTFDTAPASGTNNIVVDIVAVAV